MKEVIERILNGQYVDDERGITVFDANLEWELKSGETKEGQFVIAASGDCLIEGTVVSSDPRLELSLEQFQGKQILVEYLFHGEYLEAGDEVQGAIYILSDRGELSIPFHAHVSEGAMDSSIGPVKNLFHFANLAKTNWGEALRLFYSPAFRQVFHANDKRFDTDYLGLCAYQMHSQNMEEFLIHVNKKQKVEYSVSAEKVEYEVLFAKSAGQLTEREILVHRNGWGYTNIQVEAQGEFIVLAKTSLSEDDFVGNSARFTFFLDVSACKEGRNQGRLLFLDTYTVLEVPVIVTVGERDLLSRTRMEQKRGLVKLCKLYQSFRMKKSNLSGWLKESNKMVDSIIALDERDMRFRLFKAQLLITEGRANEAGWILKHVASGLEQAEETREIIEQKVYYLYLQTLLEKDASYVEEVVYKLRQAYRQYPEDWRIGWLLLYLDQALTENPDKKLEFLERMYQRGCTSFVVYLETLLLFHQTPTFLRKLDSFELQVLYYGMKNQALNKELVEQVMYLASKSPKYHPVLYRIMRLMMKEYRDSRTLQIVCTMLITAGLYGPEYLHWYEAAIKEKCRITNLYEYYLLSVPMEQKVNLPKAVLMYFSYQNSLGPEQSAFLYRYIVERKEELQDIYETYYVKIQQFVIAQLLKKKISFDLAYLYEKFVTEDVLNEEILHSLAELAFAYELQVQDKQLQKVVVYQPMLLKPVEYPILSGKCTVCLYGEDSSIVFEDAKGNRFISSVSYTKKRFFGAGKYLPKLKELDDGIALDVYFARNNREASIKGKVEALRSKRVFLNTQVDNRLRAKEALRLLEYLYDADLMEQLDGLLSMMKDLPLQKTERTEVIKYLVLRMQYDKTRELLERYGVEAAEIPTLLRFLSGVIASEEMERQRDEVILAACSYVLKNGKYNQAVLEYLGQFYIGPIKGLRDLYHANRTFGVNNYRVAERILVQLLYTRAYLGERNEIFQYYVAQGAGERLEKAYLAQTAYDYFVKNRIEADFIFREIFDLYGRGEELPIICKTAFLRYCSELQTEEQKSYRGCMKEWFEEHLQSRLRFAFMKNLPMESDRGELEDKTIIEYRTAPGTRAKIYYVIVDDRKENGDYRSEFMREVYPGLFVKEFVLFYGESLQYYIMEETDGNSNLTESATIQSGDLDLNRGTTRYELINDILMSRSLQDYDTLDQSLEDYLVKDYFNENLFIRK